MTDSNNEFLPLLEVETSVRNEDLDESRETETTDDECYEETTHGEPEAGVSHFQQSNTSYDSQSSSSTIDSTLKRGQEAISYFEGEALTSSSDSNKTNSVVDYNPVDDDERYIFEYTMGVDGDVDYIDINIDNFIYEEDFEHLMLKLRINHYTSIFCEGDFMLSKCKVLLERDYYYDVIPNHGGKLSQHYPAQVLIPTARRSEVSPDARFAPDYNPVMYYCKIRRTIHSRLLTRFVAPVILFDRKFICRSGSLTVRKTAVFERSRQKQPPQNMEITSSALQQIARRLADSITNLSTRTCRVASQLLLPNSMGKLRASDAEILKDLNVQRICDLMVEDRKMFKQTIRISSSEKINREIFKDCAIEQMPYPGCSFFARYNEEKYCTDGLVFDWNRPDVNVERQFSVDPYEIFPDINWAEYKEWDLVKLTQNYLKMMLSFLVKDSGGMLIHCISGWDRTPLFISLLRMSLWADGLVHESLDHREIAYFTLAYDWYLFGHNLPLRMRKKQEILRFCFDVLNSICTDDFSATRMFHELPDAEKRERVFPEYEPERRCYLIVLRSFVLELYEEYIKSVPK